MAFSPPPANFPPTPCLSPTLPRPTTPSSILSIDTPLGRDSIETFEFLEVPFGCLAKAFFKLSNDGDDCDEDDDSDDDDDEVDLCDIESGVVSVSGWLLSTSCVCVANDRC